MADDDKDIDLARRKLLRAMVYGAPLVLSTVVIKPAHAQAMSCGPTSCNPNGGPCAPSGCPPSGAACGPSMCPPRG